MKTIIYYKVNFYQKKLREDILEQLVLKDGLLPTETKGIFDMYEAAKQYEMIDVGTFIVYSKPYIHLCQGKTLVKRWAEYDEENLPDSLKNTEYGSPEFFKELDKISDKETIIKSDFPALDNMPKDAALHACYYYEDYLKCIILNPYHNHGYYLWNVYYLRNKRDYYRIFYNSQECTWEINGRFVAKDQAPLSSDGICERVNNYVCLMGEIMSNLHNRKYERRDPEYKPSEDTFVAKAAKAGISTRTLYKRRKEIGSDDLTAEQLKPRRRGKKPKNNNEDKKD